MMILVEQTKASDLLSRKNLPKESAVSSSPSATTMDMETTTMPKNDTTALLNITNSCWNRIRTLVTKKKKEETKDHNKDYYLRVFVDAGGCSGFTYQFELDHADIDPQDDVIFVDPSSTTTTTNSTAVSETDGTAARVVIDQTSLSYMKGATLDYVQEMIKSSFEIRENPQSESACGCGSSFALKKFASNPAKD
jgi:Fe-S cluster assembly iron-binding protein IscA